MTVVTVEEAKERIEELAHRATLGEEDPRNTVFVSAASCGEIVTKFQLGKLSLATGIAADVEASVLKSGMRTLPIASAHAQLTGTLPCFHKDPFDRLMTAQALLEDLPIVSRDSLFDRYGVARIW
jgi:PIN domain nuclease of toxin-antitoxin system